MQDIFLILIIIGIFVFGYIVVGRFGRFADRNHKGTFIPKTGGRNMPFSWPEKTQRK